MRRHPDTRFSQPRKPYLGCGRQVAEKTLSSGRRRAVNPRDGDSRAKWAASVSGNAVLSRISALRCTEAVMLVRAIPAISSSA